MTQKEILRLQDALIKNLEGLIGVQQALWLIREDSSEYPMHQMFAEVMSNKLRGIIEALPEDWDLDLPCI